MGPTFNLKKTKAKQNKTKEMKIKSFTDRDGERETIRFFLFSLLNLLSSIPEFLTVGFRRVKHEKCSTRRGLRVGTKNTGFHLEFRKKNWKNPNF